MKVALLLALALLSGCASYQSDYVRQNPDLDPVTRSDILSQQVRTGMTEDQCRAAWAGVAHLEAVSRGAGVTILHYSFGYRRVTLYFMDQVLTRVVDTDRH